QPYAWSRHAYDGVRRSVDADSPPDYRLIFVVTAFPDAVSQQSDRRRSGLRICKFQVAPERQFPAQDGQGVRRHSRSEVALRKIRIIAQVDKAELNGRDIFERLQPLFEIKIIGIRYSIERLFGAVRHIDASEESKPVNAGIRVSTVKNPVHDRENSGVGAD